MNPREYEQHQLALIAQDYKQRGFQVELEGRIPEAPGWRFDALARNDAGETIIIELVSKRRSFQDAQERLKALEAVAGKRPDLKVDSDTSMTTPALSGFFEISSKRVLDRTFSKL